MTADQAYHWIMLATIFAAPVAAILVTVARQANQYQNNLQHLQERIVEKQQPGYAPSVSERTQFEAFKACFWYVNRPPSSQGRRSNSGDKRADATGWSPLLQAAGHRRASIGPSPPFNCNANAMGFAMDIVTLIALIAQSATWIMLPVVIALWLLVWFFS